MEENNQIKNEFPITNLPPEEPEPIEKPKKNEPPPPSWRGRSGPTAVLAAIVFIVILIGIASLAITYIKNTPHNTACTLDAKICPDHTLVGRTGPNCTFAPCPGSDISPTTNISTLKTFTIPQIGFSFMYTSSWKVSSTKGRLEPFDDYSINIQTDNGGMQNLYVFYQLDQNNENLNSWINSLFKTEFYKIEKLNSITDCPAQGQYENNLYIIPIGYDCAIADYSDVRGEIKAPYIKRDSGIYQISRGQNSSLNETDMQNFNKLLKTISIIKSK